MRAPVILAFVAITAVTFVPSGRAEAQSRKAIAEVLFRDARELFNAGQYAAACAKFEESQRADPTTGTLLSLALCHEKVGRTASAWTEYTDAAARATRSNQDDRARFAREHVAALETKLSRLVLQVEGGSGTVAGLEISLDGEGVGAAALGTPIPVDPGEHTVEAKAPARVRWESKVTAPEGPATTTVTVPELAMLPVTAAEPAAAAAAPLPVAAPASEPAPAAGHGYERPLGYGLVAAGAVGMGVGVFFGAQTFSKRSDAAKACAGDLCTQAGMDALNTARSSATISTVAITTGLIAAAAGTYFLITAPRARSVGPVKDAWLRGGALPGAGHVTVGGAF